MQVELLLPLDPGRVTGFGSVQHYSYEDQCCPVAPEGLNIFTAVSTLRASRADVSVVNKQRHLGSHCMHTADQNSAWSPAATS